MSDTQRPRPNPGESRATELLRLVGTRTPDTSPRFTTDVVRRARAQRALAGPLRLLGGFAAALAGALAAAMRSNREGERRP